MKTRLVIALAICMIAGQFTINAQNYGQGRPDPEQMAQFAADRMAKELALDDETTKQFTELYKTYISDKFALMSQYRGMRGQQQENAANGERGRRGNNVQQNEESAAEQIVKNFERRQKMIELEQKQLALDIQYCEKFNKVLNPKQILKLYEIQNSFGRFQGGQGGNGGRPQMRGYQGGRPGGQSWPGTSDDWNEQ